VRFISKRNEVTLRDGFVYKQAESPQAAALEATILRELRGAGVAVPEVVSCGGNLLILEYLPGEPLPDVIEGGGYDSEAIAIALCDWFAAFYAAVPAVPDGTAGELRGDVNGRNFLWDGKKIHSVDFEGRCYGSRTRDAGRLAAFIETYETCDRAEQAALSQAFMRDFSERFHCGMGEIFAERDLEFEAMAQRRPAHPSPAKPYGSDR